MTRAGVVLLGATLAASSLGAQATVLTGFEISHVETVSASGEISQGDTVPAMLGSKFSFCFMPRGRPAGGATTVRLVTAFPAPGLLKPGAATPEVETVATLPIAIDHGRCTGYKLDYAWEVLPGYWTFQLWGPSGMLAQHTFVLTPLTAEDLAAPPPAASPSQFVVPPPPPAGPSPMWRFISRFWWAFVGLALVAQWALRRRRN